MASRACPRPGTSVKAALPSVFAAALLTLFGGAGLGQRPALDAVHAFFFEQSPTAFEELCARDAVQALQALQSYLAVNEGRTVVQLYDPRVEQLGRLLGREAVWAVGFHMFRAARTPVEARLWAVYGAGTATPTYAWYYHLRVHTTDPERLRVLDSVAPAAMPRSEEELDALHPRDAGEYVLRAEGYRRLAEDLRARERGEQRAAVCAEKALTDLREALHIQPGEASALAVLGAVEYGLSRDESALRHLTEAVGSDPGCIAAYRWRALVLRRLGRADGAAADAERVDALEASAEEEYLRSRSGMRQQVREVGSDSLQVFVMQNARKPAGRYVDRAFTGLGNLIEYHPTETHFRLQRGLLHHMLGHQDEALQDYDAYADAEPRVPYVQHLRAVLLAELGREESAREARRLYDQGIAQFDQPDLPDVLPPVAEQRVELDYLQVKSLGDDPAANAETLAQVLLDPASDGPTWCEAIKALSRLDNDQLVPIVPLLEDAVRMGGPNYPLRGRDIDLLVRAGQESSVAVLAYLAANPRSTPSDHWAKKAVDAIAKFPRDKAVPTLRKLALAAPLPAAASRAREQLIALLQDEYGAFVLDTILRAPQEYQIRVASPNTDALHLLVLMEIVSDRDADDTVRRHASELLRRSSCGYAADWAEQRRGV